MVEKLDDIACYQTRDVVKQSMEEAANKVAKYGNSMMQKSIYLDSKSLPRAVEYDCDSGDSCDGDGCDGGTF